MRTICVVTATRAEYGLLRPVVQKLAASSTLQLQLVATGAHLCPRLGETVREIEADAYPLRPACRFLWAMRTSQWP